MLSSSFLLKVTDFKGPQHWRWELTDDKGKFLADQEVNLDPKDANYQAFVNLDRYLWTHSDPEHRIEDQKRIMNEVGDWVGKNVFGDVGVQLAKLKVPLAVRVQVPSNARGLLYLPLEMARIGGKPLALSNARLVFELADRAQLMDKAPISEKLRILAVFSLPTDASALALRRERYELIKFINEIAQNRGLAIDLKVLQYGVTQEDLGKILMEGKGWDLVHFSGHGERAILLLEKPDGATDPVSSKALAELLAPAAKRLKLVTLSSCLSAAATIEETMRQLKLWKAGAARKAEGSEPTEEGGVPALAWELEKSLDCAVLAMRYSVGDEFAIDLASEFYRLLLDEGRPLAEALQFAMKSTIKGDYSASIPPISLATPTLCGGLAANLILVPPRAVGEFQKPYASLAGFPDETEHFVGRDGPLGRACAALAPASKKRAVLFHGMAGAGKTSCALEVAYHYHRSQTRFQWFVWYSAPTGKEISGALRNFALAMENKLKGLEMVNVIGDAEKFESWLPTLSEYLSHNSVLIVLDNIETLLKSEDGWRDKRWGSLLKALLGHKGQSRLVITSRRVPMDIDEKVVCRIPIHALSLNESLLLARELPNLGKLLAGKSSIDSEKGRDLVFRTLKLVQGHPKLIEFAEGQAADPEALERYLKEAAGSWGDDEGGLQKFFEKGESAKKAEEFMKVLMGWTRGVAGSLPDAPRILFEVLCALEGEDRLGWIVKQVWPVIWEKLGLEGEAPEVEPTVDVLKAASLVDARTIEADVEYSVHPGPAEAGLDEVPRLLFSIMSSVEGGIRRSMIEQFWPLIWGDQMNLEGQAPEIEPILDALKSAGLVKAQDIEGQSIYSIHPGVSEAGLDESGEDLRSAVDFVMADFWRSIFDQARSDESKGLGLRIVRSCLSSAPYLMRQKRWDEASTLLEQAIYRDESPGTVEMILPMLRHIVEATKGTDREIADSGIFAKALLASGKWQEAEGMFRSLISKCEAAEDSRSASATAGFLSRILTNTGRFEEALDMVENMKSYTLQAGLGPWSQISNEGLRLKILSRLGRYDEVLEEVERLRDHMRSLPDKDQDGMVMPWNVEEGILNTGLTAAACSEKWDKAVVFNADVLEVNKSRGATDLELATTAFNDWLSLMRLKRYDEAEDLLHRCRKVFEKENYIKGLSLIFGALAALEESRDHLPQALEFGQNELRYDYTLADPDPISGDHNNLANYLHEAGFKSALAHRLASALIRYQIGSGRLALTLKNLAIDMNKFDTDALPGSFDEVCKEVEKVKGVRFRELFERLPKRAKDGDEALNAVGNMLLEMLKSQSEDQPSDQSAAEE